MNKKDVGSVAFITDKNSMYCGDWGRIIYVDEDGVYGIAIADDLNSVPEFSRNQFRIPKEQSYYCKV